MKVYESNLTLRRIRQENYNGYDTHCAVEKQILELCGVQSKYTYSPSLNSGDCSLSLLVRTTEPTNLPAEKCSDVIFENGQDIKFIVRFLPYKKYLDMTLKGKESRRFIQDGIDRELKLHDYLSRAGVDATSIDELKITTTKFKKPKGRSFRLTDCEFAVEAIIFDKLAFEKAYVEGLGTKANFGYGMILTTNEPC